MAALGKRTLAIREKLKGAGAFAIDDALAFVKENASAKFVESIDVSINLGVDPRKSDQVVRSSTVMPNGTGKTVRVAVFAQGANADAAKEAGADVIGFEDLAEDIKKGNMDFDVVIATPDAMRIVGQLGQVRYRTDKAGIIHCPIGNASFEIDALRQNLQALIDDLNKLKPSSAKGTYIKKISVSSTMGAGVTVDKSFLG